MFGFNERYITKDNQPWFPVMGEIHYSRLPQIEWKDELYKMKAGGVTVIASYVIWIHHEEIEGQWDFGGCRDLRLFLETVKNCGMYMVLRVGPWVHAEVRNGGFPDWLLKKDFEPRTNDDRYFEHVRTLYEKIYTQAQGFLFKDGGPIIGLQIENEYGHCGGLSGEEGEAHMRTLTKIAKDVGFDVPLYTATGWGGAVTGGLLPVMGGYCEAPWDQRLTEIEPSGNYIFTHERNDHNIGSDRGLGAGLTFDTSVFPFLTAELGGGLQVTKHRRPVATAKDTAAMSVVKLGSGVNLLGYYMYHGGVNPEGKLSTLQESRDTGYLNDLPVKSYDFRAPLGTYGQITETHKELKLLAMFVEDFGGELCRMPAYIPEDNPLDPENDKDLRYSFRHNGEWGFVFFNNYLRRFPRPDFKGVSFKPIGMDITLKDIDVLSGEFGFYPFNMPVDGGVISFAEATPLCKINDTTVLYGKNSYHTGKVLLISKADALNAYRVKLDKDYLFVCPYPVLPDDEGFHVLAEGDITLKVFPQLPSVPQGFEAEGMDGEFAVYTKRIEKDGAACELHRKSETEYKLIFNGLDDDAYDYMLHLEYRAESARAYIDGKLVIDDFWADGNWDIGLKRHELPKEMDIELSVLYENEPMFLETWPKLENGKISVIDSVGLVRIMRVPLKLA